MTAAVAPKLVNRSPPPDFQISPLLIPSPASIPLVPLSRSIFDSQLKIQDSKRPSLFIQTQETPFPKTPQTPVTPSSHPASPPPFVQTPVYGTSSPSRPVAPPILQFPQEVLSWVVVDRKSVATNEYEEIREACVTFAGFLHFFAFKPFCDYVYAKRSSQPNGDPMIFFDTKFVLSVSLKECENQVLNQDSGLGCLFRNMLLILKSNYATYEPHLKTTLEQFVKSRDGQILQMNQTSILFRTNDIKVYEVQWKDIQDFFPPCSIRSLRPSVHINQLVCLKALFIREGETLVRPTELVYRCKTCGVEIESVGLAFIHTFDRDGVRNQKPRKCKTITCNEKEKFEFDARKSKFENFKWLKLQDVSTATTGVPVSLEAILTHSMTAMMDNSTSHSLSGAYWFVGTIQAFPLYDDAKDSKSEKDRLMKDREPRPAAHQDFDVVLFQTKARMHHRMVLVVSNMEPVVSSHHIRVSATQAEAYAYLCRSQNWKAVQSFWTQHFAPSIFGFDHVKLGILLMMVGGCSKTTATNQKMRGTIHVLIIGDPGIAKSQMLLYAKSLHHKAIYTSAKSSSAAGLTAAVLANTDKKGDFQTRFHIQPGAMVLASGSICCLDEFDKIEETDRDVLHEAMEQQTVSIHKAGLNAQLPCVTSVLAAANPIMGRYQSTLTLQQNLNMPDSILSRFDLIYVVKDHGNSVADRKLAESIVGRHRMMNGGQEQEAQADEKKNDRFNHAFISDFIACVRTRSVKLTDEAIKKLQYEYVNLRKVHSDSKTWITPRSLQAMIRLSEACAKVHLSDQVREEHVQTACELILSHSDISL
jgi:DNA replicative helicase MCM subunit Mcm2 (Cdc46/Mcm family)